MVPALGACGLRARWAVFRIIPDKTLAEMAAYLTNALICQVIDRRKPMRVPLVFIALLAACTTGPFSGAGPGSQTGANAPLTSGFPAAMKRRGAVELVVKANYDAIRRDIDAGGGLALTKAMDAAGVPEADRPTRVMQLQSDIGTGAGPGALITALLLYGSS